MPLFYFLYKKEPADIGQLFRETRLKKRFHRAAASKAVIQERKLSILMAQKIKKLWGGVNVVLIIAVAFLAIALAGVRLVGLDVYVILSGSREPEYQTGGVIYIKDVDTATLGSGDVITYKISNGATVTHRIVDVVEEDGQTMYQTKGDANDNVDASLVPQSQVIGQPVFTIPYLGYLVSMIQSPSGKYALIAVAAILLLMQFLPDLIFGEDDDEDEEDNKESSKEEGQ